MDREFIIDRFNSYINKEKNNINHQARMENNKLKRSINKNKDLSVISSNCIGSMMVNDLGLRHNSPFVNLYLKPRYFIKYLKNIYHYLNSELKFVKEERYPVGMLDDIEIRFLHYKSEEESKDKWTLRSQRINLDNLFIIMAERDGCTYQDLIDFDNLPFENKVVFTHKEYPEIKSSFYIKGFENLDHIGVLVDFYSFTGKRYYDQFNYVDWFNGIPLEEIKMNLNIFNKNEESNSKEIMSKLIKTPINKINKLFIKDKVLFIEGLAYIQGFNSPNYKYLFKYLRLQNLFTESEYKEYELGTVNRHDLKKVNYNGFEFDYTAAGTATMGFNGINIDDLSEGIYELQLSIADNKNTREYSSLNFDKSELDIRNVDNKFEYRLFKNRGKVFLVKRSVFGREPYKDTFLSVDNSWSRDMLFHIEGKFIIPGLDITEFNQANYYLVTKKERSQAQYVFELGQVKKENMGNYINNQYGSYNACYYATKMLKGIDTHSFEFGIYDLYISLSYKSEIFTAKLNLKLEVKDNECRLFQ